MVSPTSSHITEGNVSQQEEPLCATGEAGIQPIQPVKYLQQAESSEADNGNVSIFPFSFSRYDLVTSYPVLIVSLKEGKLYCVVII